LEEDGAVAFGDAGFETALCACAGFDRAGTLLLAGRFAARGDLRDVFTDFDFDFRVAMWLSSWVNNSITCCH
jgi:hypothetical protein